MSVRKPKVSIGVPVYNGERYLRQALNAIARQTFTDFEVIICDNASTDGTEAITREFTARDQRFRYHRNQENIGAARNFNRTFELATGEYFKWAAADDLISPDYLAKTVPVLNTGPDVALCYTKVKVIDDDSRVVGEHLVALQHTADASPSRRFGEFIRRSPTCFQVFGLFRANVLAQTPLIASHVGSDKTLIAEISLRGKVVFLPECLFFSRQHDGRSVKLPREKLAAWYDPRSGRSRMPTWRKWKENLAVVGRVSLPPGERIKSYGQAILWAFSSRNLALLGLDIANILAPGSWSRVWDFYERHFRPRGYSIENYRYYEQPQSLETIWKNDGD